MVPMLMRDVEMPARIASLSKDARGFPIPWFVKAADPIDFRVLRPGALQIAWQKETCWICGQPLGVFKVYVIGPLFAIQKISSEPASHRDCAEYAMMVCPFIANPNMRRGDRAYPADSVELPGYELRNPGLYLLWITREPYRELAFSYLKLPQWKELVWYRQRRIATREEVMDALWAGAGKLRDSAPDPNSSTRRKFEECISEMHKLIPPQ